MKTAAALCFQCAIRGACVELCPPHGVLASRMTDGGTAVLSDRLMGGWSCCILVPVQQGVDYVHGCYRSIAWDAHRHNLLLIHCWTDH